MLNPILLLLVVLLIPLMILLAKLNLSNKIDYWRELYRKVFTRALSEVSNLRKLYASKEGTGRIKVLVLNESSMPMDLSGNKVNTPRRSLFLNKRSMTLFLSREHTLKMIFHHKTIKARTSFKRRLMHLKKHLRPWSSGFPRLHQVLPYQVRLRL